MASIKISELNEKTSLNSGDLLPIVDIIEDETEKMSYSNFKTQIINDTFAVITGTIEANSGTGSIPTTLSYPTGFNMDNCVVVSLMVGNSNGQDNGQFVYGTKNTLDSSVQGGFNNEIKLGSENITIISRCIYLRNENPISVIGWAYVRDIKLVLLKTSQHIKEGIFKMKEWFKYAGIRALKTVAQTAITIIGTSAVMSEVNWLMVLSASLLAGILSLLTSIVGLPELENKGDYKI